MRIVGLAVWSAFLLGVSAAHLHGGRKHSVTVGWATNPDAVSGYRMYRGASTGGPYALISGASPITMTSYTDSAVQSGQVYYYVATAVNDSNLESNYSNELSAMIPTP